MTPGRDLVQFDKKRREARTKGQVTYKCDLLFCSGLHRLFTKENKRRSFICGAVYGIFLVIIRTKVINDPYQPYLYFLFHPGALEAL